MWLEQQKKTITLLAAIVCVSAMFLPMFRSIALQLLGIYAIVTFFGGYIANSENPLKALCWVLIPPIILLPLLFWLLNIRSERELILFLLIFKIAGIPVLVRWLGRIICNYIGDAAITPWTGGKEEIERSFLSSVPLALRKRRQYTEAIANIDEQLAELARVEAENMDALLLKAKIYAEDLHNFSQGEQIVREVLKRDDIPVKIGARIYNMLADWQLKHQRNIGGAQIALEELIVRYPETEAATLAEQRIHHLALPDVEKKKPVRVVRIVEDLGLKKGFKGWDLHEKTPLQEVTELNEYLRENPKDWEAREKLAHLYAKTLGDTDAGIAELDYLLKDVEARIANGLPRKRIAKWLNRKTDYYLLSKTLQPEIALECAHQTLQLIETLFPGTPEASIAERRLALLKLEQVGRQRTSE